ncbi:hypothetical protein DRH29_03010 [candidate division Kazan bacterium]|uniref:Uncharacterized protein n=1 Tax=candidate division Kazan bacterium TaxID=2202143 RepID=A0A420ZCH1_UNCK3|nr:MAG: hypothetical protein DRH29_03010 [candidate division Kazan bacterium]
MSNAETTVIVEFNTGYSKKPFVCPATSRDNRYSTSAPIIFKAHQTLYPSKNIYEMEIYSSKGSAYYPYTSIFDDLFDLNQSPLTVSIKVVNVFGKGYVLRNGVVTSIKHTEIKINGQIIPGIKVIATDALSFYLSQITPNMPQKTGTIKNIMESIFREYSDYLGEFYVSVDKFDPSFKTSIQINFDGKNTLEDTLNNICQSQDWMWCVIDNVLYISKSINIPSYYTRIEKRIFGNIAISPILYYDKELKTHSMARFISGSTPDDPQHAEFYMYDLRPGMSLVFDSRGTENIRDEKIKFLVTSIIHRYNGIYLASIEGLILDKTQEKSHKFRYMLTKGIGDPVKFRYRIENSIKHNIDARPTFTIGKVLHQSNGLYDVVIGQSTLNPGTSGSLHNQNFNESLVLKNVPISSLFNEVGINSPQLPTGTKVLVVFNNSNINDPIIVGIVQNQTGLPYITINGNDIQIAGSPTGKVKLGGNATRSVARTMDTVEVPFMGATLIGTIKTGSNKVKAV